MFYNYFRDYDPAIGRYVQSDPIGLRGGVNTYGYVHSPLTEIDPEGQMGRSAGSGTVSPPPYGFGGGGAKKRVSRQCFLVCMGLKTAIGLTSGIGFSRGMSLMRPNVTSFGKALIDTAQDFVFRPINSLPGLVASELISAWICQDLCVDNQMCTPESDDSVLGDTRRILKVISDDFRHFVGK